jgi:hypothetical protein
VSALETGKEEEVEIENTPELHHAPRHGPSLHKTAAFFFAYREPVAICCRSLRSIVGIRQKYISFSDDNVAVLDEGRYLDLLETPQTFKKKKKKKEKLTSASVAM